MSIATEMEVVPKAAVATTNLPLRGIRDAVLRFVNWLDQYEEETYDFQSYYSGPIGRRAKQLYYTNRRLGTLAVLPIVFSEALVPSARKLFWKPQRVPIGDAHYAMGFAYLAEALGSETHYKRALHFLEVLKATRCPGYEEYCWGYPFHWETINGTIPSGTPLITTVPYVFEAFQQVYRMDGNDEWYQILRSIARHAVTDYKDVPTSDSASTCSYTPFPEHSLMVVNANAYRAWLLTNAGHEFSDESYNAIAERNLNFVLEAQNADGSWFYARDGKRSFVDHFHTCFVMKALAKIEASTGNGDCTSAIERGVAYYTQNLFEEQGIPKPFSKAPRLTVYKRELYDYAECINLAMLLRGRFPALDQHLETTIADILNRWQTKEGSFRSRQLYMGWDNTPMHRWASAQLFRSLCLVLSKNSQMLASNY